MEQQTLKPGDRVIVVANFPDDGLFNGDTGRVVETAQGAGVEFDKHEAGTTTYAVVDGGQAVNILDHVELIVPPLFPGDLPMDHDHYSEPHFEQLLALLEAYHETDYGRIQTRITSTIPGGLAHAYLNGFLAGTWHGNGLDNGRITKKGMDAVNDAAVMFAMIYIEKKPRSVKHAKPRKGWNRKKV